MAAPQFLVMNFIGELESFDPSGPLTLDQWYKRFENFCNTNAVLPEPVDANNQYLMAPNRRRHMFLHFMGPRAFAIVEMACLPADPTSTPIPRLLQLLRQHFQPAGLIEANRFSFHQRMQQTNESVFEYISALQSLAVSCEWGAFYDQAMKSQIITGIRHQDTRQKLISTPNLNWAMAKETALQDDALRTQMRALTQVHNQTNARVNTVFKKPAAKQQGNQKAQPQPQAQPSQKPQKNTDKSGNDKKMGPCFRCLRLHDSKTCIVASWVCKYCHQKGHIVKACPKKKDKAQVNAVHSSTGNVDDESFVDSLLDFD